MGRTVIDGTIIDADGAVKGYAVLDDSGRVLERGSSGAIGLPHGRIVKGIVLPRPINGHTHLGDALWRAEPPRGRLSDIVRPPNGLKHKLLASASRKEKVEAMRGALLGMGASGLGMTLDFREEGLEGIRMLKEASLGSTVSPFILGRPLDPSDRGEVDMVLNEGDGIGLSALKDMDPNLAEVVSSQTIQAGKFLAMHVSEDEREGIDEVLELHPSLLVHLTQATDSDMERVVNSNTPIVFCPRSNALFGRWPPISKASGMGARFMLGTDNVMFNAPDIFREMEFAYVTARMRGEELTPHALVRSVFLTPWEVIGHQDGARLIPGSGTRAIALSLGEKDPYYEVCVRASNSCVVATHQEPGSPEE